MKLFFFTIFLLLSLQLKAKDFYVNARTGNDRFNGLSISKAKKTIQEAANLTKPGDTVFVMDGVYSNVCADCNVVNITRSGKQDKYIVYQNFPGQHPVISFDGWAGFFIQSGVSYIKISGFEVVGDNAKLNVAKALKQPGSCANKKGKIDPKFNGNGIVIDGLGKKHAHHIEILDNIVHDCPGGGIGASHCDYIRVEGNTVYNTSWYTIFGTSGISFYEFWNYDNARGYHNVIARNKCYNNKSFVPWLKYCVIYDGNGIIIDDFRSKQNPAKQGAYKSRTLVQNNICWYNGGTGIHTFQTDHVDIINNTAYCNCQNAEVKAGQILSGIGDDNKIVNNILVSDKDIILNSNYGNSHFMYENNLHYNVSNPGKEKISITTGSCINGENPLFVNPANSLKADFHLQAKSPAINHGHLRIYSTYDYDGKKRGEGHTADLGAYEY